MTRISLCLIARNEERLLPECLASAREVVDEMIVVDTGSTDRTVELARAAGAQVFSLPWQEDFSAPRNEALAHATGDWVLQLDADERLTPRAAKALRRAIGEGGFECGFLPLHNAARLDASWEQVVSGEARKGDAVLLPRLFKRTKDLRWEGAIHESVTSWLVERGQAPRVVPVDIVHLGYLHEVKDEKKKAERNLSLLRRRCAQEPGDLTARGYLAHELYAQGMKEEARRVADEGWAMRETSPAYRTLHRLAVTRGLLAIEVGRPEVTLDCLAAAEEKSGPQAEFDFLRACAYEVQANSSRGPRRARLLGLADAALAAAQGRRRAVVLDRIIHGVDSWGAAYRRGLLALGRGDFSAALGFFEAALKDKSDYAEAKLGRVEALLGARRVEEALRDVMPLLGEKPDGWLLAARAAEELGAFDDLKTFLAQAVRRLEAGLLSPHRAALKDELVRAVSLSDGKPARGPGAMGALGALMTRSEFVEPPVPAPEAMVRRVVSNLVRRGQEAFLVTLLEPRAEDALPGLPAQVRRTLDGLGLHVEEDHQPAPVFVGTVGEVEGKLVRAILAGHPRLFTSHLPGEAPAVLSHLCESMRAHAHEGGRRPVWLGLGPLLQMEQLVRELPQARFVFIAGANASAAQRADVRAQAARLPGAFLEVDFEALLADPVVQLQRLFAFIGEAAPEGVIRAVVEGYPSAVSRRAQGGSR